ncbi:MAG TPA: type II secretion system protein GspC [Polyangiaceae bacterium]|nr:type II secretion system protein GspC [Polyangiaceae bacterium]
MGVERFARKSFGFVVVLLLALAIYFQAAGTMELVASSAFAAAPAPAGKARRARRKPPVLAKGSTTNGDAILARNPFDSVTGPLDRTPITAELPEQQQEAADVTDPLHAPECDDVAVNIITESPDPAWSLAQLKGPGDPDAATRRVGDDVGKMKVAYIGYNAEKASPAVWLLSSEKLCQALLFSEKKAKAEASSGEAAPAAPAPAEERPARRAARSGAGAVPPDIAAKIHKVSETEFNVDRSVVDSILENQATLMRSARIVPEQKDGKTVGIRLFGIRPDTLLGSLGLQNGDRLESINGFDVANPEKALEAFAHLRTASALQVHLNRRGKDTNLQININ